MSTVDRGRWLDQVESLARDALPEPVFRYVAEGARDEITLGEAVAAWQSIRIAPRIFRDVRHVETSATLLGTPFALPLGVAPMTLQRAAHPDGEVAMARAAAGAGVPLVVSSNAGSTFAAIAGTGVTWWLQAYVGPDRADSLPMLEAAVAAGAAALVLTADTPVLGTRYPSQGSARVWEVADPGWLGANEPPRPGLAGLGLLRRRSRARRDGGRGRGRLGRIGSHPMCCATSARSTPPWCSAPRSGSRSASPRPRCSAAPTPRASGRWHARRAPRACRTWSQATQGSASTRSGQSGPGGCRPTSRPTVRANGVSHARGGSESKGSSPRWCSRVVGHGRG